MRILFVVPSYYPHIGGVEYVVKSVAERLARKKHEIKVIAGESSIETPREEEVNDIQVLRWPTWAPSDAYHIPRRRSDLAETLRELAREADVMHFHSLHSILTVYSMKVAKDISVKKVLTPHYHGTGHTVFRSLLWIPWRSYIKSLIKLKDGLDLVVHTISNHEAEVFKRHYGIDSVTIGHGVEEWLSDIEWKPHDYALYAGRIEKYKNVNRLANIVHELKNLGINLKLVVIGNGSYRKHLERDLRRKGMEYEIMPFQPYEKYIEYLSHAQFYGLLSQREAYGQSVNEANAIGVPAVIAKPWGLNFSNRRRTLICDLSEDYGSLVLQVKEFLSRVKKEPKSYIPSWSLIAEEYLSKLYK